MDGLIAMIIKDHEHFIDEVNSSIRICFFIAIINSYRITNHRRFLLLSYKTGI